MSFRQLPGANSGTWFLLKGFILGILCYLACFVLVEISELSGQELDCNSRPDLQYKTHIGEQYHAEKQINIGVVHDLSVARPGKSYRHFRVLLHKKATAPDQWVLTLSDPTSGRAWQHITSNDLRGADLIWSRRLPGAKATAHLWATGQPNDFLERLEYLAVPDDPSIVPYYSVQEKGKERWRPLFCPSSQTSGDCASTKWALRRAGDGVGFITFHYGQRAWTCSGFLIAPAIVITNWHCGGSPEQDPSDYWNDELQRSIIVDFSWDGDEQSNEFHFAELIELDKDLDYAVLRVHAAGQNFGDPFFFELNRAFDYNSQSRKEITIIHHPLALVKHITSGCNIVSGSYASWVHKTDGTDFTHICDTEGGSSGAPVLDADGRVIGIHHRGFAVDPTSPTGCDRQNKAVRIDKVWEKFTPKMRNLVDGR